jgi:hypothetical protein
MSLAPLLIIPIISFLVGIILSHLITRYYILRRYNTTIKYKNALIERYIEENKRIMAAVRKYEYNTGRKVVD